MQRHAPEEGSRVGVAFHDGPALVNTGEEVTVILSMIFYPHPVYDRLQAGISFTVWEGARIVGYGQVRRWLT